jgi:hypothetical protein
VRVRVGTGFAPQTIVHRAWKYISSVVRRDCERAIVTKKEARGRQRQYSNSKEKTREKEPIVMCQRDM